jgi:hypothetical protein
MKKLVFFILAIGLFFAANAQKTAVHWYLANMSLDQAKNLSHYDMVVVDAENIFNNPRSLKLLKTNHPGILLVCYLNPIEVFDPAYSDKPWSIALLKELKKHKDWWFQDGAGKQMVFWSGMKMLNCRLDNGYPYLEYLFKSFEKNILTSGFFDGVLYDNLWDRINWIGGFGGNKGLAYNDNQDTTKLDSQWRLGLRYLTKKIKIKHQKWIFISNPGSNMLYTETVPNKMFENFPDKFLGGRADGWYNSLLNATKLETIGSHTIFNARENNYFFTLCSSMLLDNVYFSDCQNKPWVEKYQLKLGHPVGKYLIDHDVDGEFFCRPYEKGKIIVYPDSGKAYVKYNNGETRKE